MVLKDLNLVIMCDMILEKKGEKTVIFIHGFFGNIETFRPQGELLKEHGFSYALVTYPKTEFTLVDFVDCVAEKLMDRGIEKFSVLGTSMGGFSAQIFASRYNSKIDSLILTNTFASTVYFRKKNKFIISIAPFLPEGMIKFYLKSVVKREYGQFTKVNKLLELVDALTKRDVLIRLKALMEFEGIEFKKNFPVAVLDSADDVTIPDMLKEELKLKVSPDFEYTFKEGGHFPYIFARQEFNDIILKFLNGVYNSDYS